MRRQSIGSSASNLIRWFSKNKLSRLVKRSKELDDYKAFREKLQFPRSRKFDKSCGTCQPALPFNWVQIPHKLNFFNQKCCNVDVAMKNSFSSNYHKTRNTFAPSLSMCWNIVFGTGSAMLKVSSCLSAWREKDPG